MNKGTIISSLAVLAVLAGGVSFAEAYNGHRGMGYEQGYGSGRGFHNFDNCPYADGSGRGYYGYYNKQGKQLSDKQIEQLNDLREKHFAAMEPLRQNLHIKRMELNSLKYNPNVKPETLRKLVEEIIAAENKIDEEREAFRAKAEKDFGIEYFGGFGKHHRPGRMHRACF